MSAPILGIITPHPPIMVPEVGGERAAVTAESTEAMEHAADVLRAFAPETLVLMSPHAPLAGDAFLIDDSSRLAGDLGAFGAPSVRIDASGDPVLARAIIAEAAAQGLTAVARSSSRPFEPGVLDHAALVPLSFLDRAGNYALVELSLSFLPLHAHHLLGRAVRAAADRVGRKVAFIASGDCSHRLTPDAPAGFSPRGAEFDAALVSIIERARFEDLEQLDPGLIDAAGECGLRSFIALGGYIEGTDATTRVLSYEGPWGVGYLTALAGSPAVLDQAGTPPAGAKGGRAGDAESPPVALARRTIETFVREGKVIEPPAAEGLLASRHGAFVSLHSKGQLRGCIGTIGPTQPTLAAEIVHNAIQAATADPRFPSLTPAELADLDISVDVLQEAEPAALEDLDPRHYGVIVSCDWRRGLLLPDLEGVDTAEDQVTIACLKAGIGPEESIHLERFCVDRYH